VTNNTTSGVAIGYLPPGAE